MKSKRILLITAVSISGMIGCGGLEEFPVAAVSGKVTCQGKPIPHAMVFFEPVTAGKSAITGKQGFGTCNKNGEFTISTYGEQDGAVIGKHLVHVMPPHAEDHPGFKCPCEFNSQSQKIEVEVKNGEINSFDFALPVAVRSVAMSPDQLEAMEEAAINRAASKR